MGKFFTRRNLIIVLSVVIAIVIVWFIVLVSLPIIFAFVSALFIEPVVRYTERKFKWKRNIAVLSIFIFIMALLSTLLYYTITKLVGKLIDFTKVAPEYFNTLSGFWIDIQSKLFQYTAGMPPDVVGAIQIEFKAIFESVRLSILNYISYANIMSLMSEIPNFLVSFTVI